MRIISVAVLVTSVALTGGVARADTHTSAFDDPQKSFAETDRNKDGQVDREEFHQRQVDVFYLADANKDGVLSPGEFATIDKHTSFEDMDRNGDGSLSLYEFISYRFEQFDTADTDGNGLLSLEEVEAYVNP
jgi:Ca2+-binding EF-hand superfamily protein